MIVNPKFGEETSLMDHIGPKARCGLGTFEVQRNHQRNSGSLMKGIFLQISMKHNIV